MYNFMLINWNMQNSQFSRKTKITNSQEETEKLNRAITVKKILLV